MIDKQTAEHYTWGDICDGWHLLKGENLSVIEERIPPGGTEIAHHHDRARQFFYVLAGRLSFEMGGRVIDVAPRQGIEIKPGTKHRVFNRGHTDAEFLVISNPPTKGDRVGG